MFYLTAKKLAQAIVAPLNPPALDSVDTLSSTTVETERAEAWK
jgi:hypothetical protein